MVVAVAPLWMGAAGLSEAAVRDVVIADVSTRAFSVIWVSDQPVTDTTVRVYADGNGSSDLTPELTVEVTSALIPSAHDLGIVKVDVWGLQASTTYFVETETDGLVYPASGPLLEVTTAAAATAANLDGTPIANDLLIHDLLAPDGGAPANGALLVLKVPSLSQYPLTAFVADGVAAPGTVVDLSNLVSDATGTNAQVTGGTVIEISEYRGLLCTNLDDQKLVRLRHAPDHEETPAISEAEVPSTCFAPGGTAADFNCDGAVNPVDFNEFLIKFGLSNNGAVPDCRFNPDFDLAPDGQIDPVDFNEFLIVFGTTE